MRTSIVLALMSLGLVPGIASGYTDDEFCQAIGETSRSALQPRDRLFFEKNCSCFGALGCAKTGSKAWKALKRRSDAITAQLRAEDERKRADEKAERERSVIAAATRAAEFCQRFVSCLEQYRREEGAPSICVLLQNQIEQACCDSGGAAVACAEKARDVVDSRKCDAFGGSAGPP